MMFKYINITDGYWSYCKAPYHAYTLKLPNCYTFAYIIDDRGWLLIKSKNETEWHCWLSLNLCGILNSMSIYIVIIIDSADKQWQVFFMIYEN